MPRKLVPWWLFTAAVPTKTSGFPVPSSVPLCAALLCTTCSMWLPASSSQMLITVNMCNTWDPVKDLGFLALWAAGELQQQVSGEL